MKKAEIKEFPSKVKKLLSVLLPLGLLICLPFNLTAQSKAQLYIPQKDASPVRGQPYERYFTQDKFKRIITFYLSETSGSQTALPLVVYIHGSGCNSFFNLRSERVVPAAGHATVQDAVKGKARVLIVEKPGVKFLDQPEKGCAENREFNREHTLERWAEAVEAAIRAAHKLSGIKKDKTLVIGHSEGGLVASRVSRNLQGIVSHVALLAAGGPTQLFDLIALARKGIFFRRISENAEERVKYVLDEWRKIQAEPASAEKFFFGFAYRRWATFLSTSSIEELKTVTAQIYIAQGVKDDAVDVASADALYAQLQSWGKQVVYKRIEEADHSFNIKSKPEINGWQELFDQIIKWFFEL